ncbi:MAG TPA: glycosyltransferase family 2 protein [Chitinophagaceae bacterium]|nr:glycosyltransferase family 2 protein [Chitinophagaceae bacterium]
MPPITASIVLYNHAPAFLQPLISSILACGLVRKLFLVDNSATNALKMLTGDSRVEYIFNNANIGYGAAHNIAIRKAFALAKYHIVFNPDIAFEPGTIEKIAAYMEEYPRTGQLMPKIIYPNGSLQYTCKLLPAPADLITRRFLPAALIKKRMQRFEMRDSGYDKIMEVPYLSGCFMFLRLDAVKQAGLFDERFFMYPEDIDLTRRINKFYKTIYYPGVYAIHAHERGSYKNARLFFIHIINIIRYFNKWGWIFDAERKRINKRVEAQYKHQHDNKESALKKLI